MAAARREASGPLLGLLLLLPAVLLLLPSLIPLREVSAMASTTTTSASAPLGGPSQPEMASFGSFPGHAHRPYRMRYTVRDLYIMHTQQVGFRQWGCCSAGRIDPRARRPSCHHPTPCPPSPSP
uniref:Uncharacterized protein n=1 Tax=Oryza brachyantha TaxID=4533 RepID=J3NC76_ORYBR